LSKNAIAILTTLGTGLFIAAFILFFYTPPQARIGPEQPIPFSHNVHSGVKQIQCQYCHPYVAYSNHPGIPAVEKCLHCHKYIIANHPWIKKEHEYFSTDTPTPWVKVNYNNKIACQECHGQVQAIQRLPQKIWRMGECVECHRIKNVNLDCWLACHS